MILFLIFLLAQPICTDEQKNELCKVQGSGNVWRYGPYSWAGNPACFTGWLLAPDSPAIDTGAFIEGFHCPQPGLDPSGCVEWFVATDHPAPDIGACEYVPYTPSVTPPRPQDLRLS